MKISLCALLTFLYTFQLLQAHLHTKKQVENVKKSDILHEQAIQRHFIHPHVKRIELDDRIAGRLRGTLFVPKNAGND